MTISIKKLLTLLAVLIPAALSAQQSYKPQLYGVVRPRVEFDTQDGEHMFNVRHSRLGVRGFAGNNLRYAVQIELNSQGNFSVLDSYAAYTIGNFDISLGQQQYQFTTELNRGAGRNYFANRSFMGKFISQYHSSSGELSDIGSRDLGALVTYNLKTRIPVSFVLGGFNGGTANNPRWGKTVNVIGRVEIGAEQGLKISGSYYTGKSPFGDKMQMWGAEARYANEKFIIESEVAQRELFLSTGNDALTAAVVHAMFIFPLKDNLYAKNIMPLLRWDYGNNIKYISEATPALESFTAHRITAGITIGLMTKVLDSEIRFNYEHYLPSARPSDFGTNKLLHNKFTIEFFAAF